MEALRRGQVKPRELVSLAKKLGREFRHGKHPTYVHPIFRELRPICIPDHGGKDITPGVKNIILDQFDDDILKWEEWLDIHERINEENDEDEDQGGDSNGENDDPDN